MIRLQALQGSLRFNSLFIGIGSAIAGLEGHNSRWRKGFNSLFIGIGSAIDGFCGDLVDCEGMFQFPFHRDRLCNDALRYLIKLDVDSFNSLFIGIGSAIGS